MEAVSVMLFTPDLIRYQGEEQSTHRVAE